MFEMTKENIHFFKSPPSMEACLHRVGSESYWIVDGRFCYKAPDPKFIIHNHVVVEATDDAKKRYESYFHATKKPLYAMSHYTLADLKDVATRLELPTEGTKKSLYTSIEERIQKEFKPEFCKRNECNVNHVDFHV